MFSFQNQNQVILHLSQLSAKVNQRQRAYFSKKIKKQTLKPENKHIICQDSFTQAVKNFDLSVFSDLNIKKVCKNLPTNNLNVSYISSRSFFENNNGFCKDDLKYDAISTISAKEKKIFVPNDLFPKLYVATKDLLQNKYLIVDVQARSFKTWRSSQAEKLRNPSAIMRIKNKIRPRKPGTLENRQKNDLANSSARLQNMLNDTNLTQTDKQRLKLAFADGYLIAQGSSPEKANKAFRLLKIGTQLLTIFLFLGIFIVLGASATTSMFGIEIGKQIEIDPELIHVKFDDVKGADEAKEELQEIVEFLRNPEKFTTLGGKLPKGVLLVGPPGTGKTLLARAVAGEAGVPFFIAAGPEFEEILVGQGARRVRDLFKAAKERAPCVIFIDEIDSVGSQRTNSALHPYANQTLNQLLTEMDGFHQNEGVIVVGATNRRGQLDRALLRPGRFDVEVNVPTPDFVGRKQILELYLSKVLAKGIDVELLARGTTGFTGADLENVVNQAAVRAAMDGAPFVSMKYLELSRDKILMGPQKSRILDVEANTITAYHEGGHAIVAYFTKGSDPLHKVTIIPRGPSFGHTAYIPIKEQYHVTKSKLLAIMDTMLGGRAAEEIIFGHDKITSGASSDLQEATEIATRMVRDWGMSEKVGLRSTPAVQDDARGDIAVSPATTEIIDSEIRRILNESYDRAKYILKTHSKEHKVLAEALLRYETLDADDIKAIMEHKKPELKSK